MDLYELLLEAKKKRFEANAIIEKIGKDTESDIRNELTGKLKGYTINRDGFEYIFYKVKVYYDDWGYADNKFTIQLSFIPTFRLTKAQNEKLSKFKLGKLGLHDSWSKKTKVWITEEFEIEARKAIKREFNLRIEKSE